MRFAFEGWERETMEMKIDMKKECSILILWDIDGTLLHCGGDGAKALDQAFLQLYGIPDAFAKARIGHAMDQALIEELMADFSLDPAQIPMVKEAYGKALREILEQNSKKRVLPGIESLLELLQKEPDLYNGILTSNLRLGAAIKLEVMGLLPYFTFQSLEDLASEKWEEAQREISDMEKLHGVSFQRERVILVGDTAYDIQTAKLLQAKSIGVATGWASRETLLAAKPDYLFDDLSHPHEFIQVIRGLVHEHI